MRLTSLIGSGVCLRETRIAFVDFFSVTSALRNGDHWSGREALCAYSFEIVSYGRAFLEGLV